MTELLMMKFNCWQTLNYQSYIIIDYLSIYDKLSIYPKYMYLSLYLEVKLTSASTSVCQSLTQLRAGSVEKAGQILDYIIANRQPEDQVTSSHRDRTMEVK